MSRATAKLGLGHHRGNRRWRGVLQADREQRPARAPWANVTLEVCADAHRRPGMPPALVRPAYLELRPHSFRGTQRARCVVIEEDPFDETLTPYGRTNHGRGLVERRLPRNQHSGGANVFGVSAEFARVTKGYFKTTVRSVGSTPTIFIDSIDKARHFQHDHAQDICKIELYDGRRFGLRFHLFGASELRSCFANRFAIEDLRGLDLFHSRFAPDLRWNPASQPVDRPFRDHLARLEDAYSRNHEFMERATHLLLVGRPCHSQDQLDHMPFSTLRSAS